MLSNVFLKSLGDQRRSLMFWGIGVAALAVVTVLFYPTISKAEGLADIFEETDAIARLFAGGFTDVTTPEGFLNSQLYSLMAPALLLVYAIGQGSGAIAGEEERGTLDLLLSDPVTRLEVLSQKTAAMIAGLLGLSFVLWLGVVVGTVIVDMDLSIWRTMQVTLSGVLLGTVFGALALALGCARGKRGLSIGATGGLAVAVYFVYALAPLAEGLSPLEKLSPFYYYIGADPLANGLNPTHTAALIGISAALLVVAAVTFERRDLTV